ncbi:response regulator [Geminocystis sp. GBBB08]|uniref:sensor histidine kinase n=1 Tax=Geminocystis sp. GBBB08 TaxID=2604140 RepID=UPI0027E395A3|nr:response regulator [Geminocystis sp. GBBB08]MBL1211038.1 response regulator [Geminocystis sp. GBBB08]
MLKNQEKFKGDILIVDDIPENLELLFQILTEHNYEVRRVLNGKQALNIAIIDSPDLILLDIKMPEIDGYEVCRQLKNNQKTQDIPVIFLSALNETFDKVKAFQMGGVDYITKPFQIREVLARVENQLQLIKTKKILEEKNQLLISTNRQLELQKQELEIVNQELEAFNYRVSHDIRNELSIIQGFSRILLENTCTNKPIESEEALKSIVSASQLIEQIINDLTRLTRINSQELEFQKVDLSLMVKNIISNLEQQKNDREVNWQITPNINTYGDPQLLYIALDNLLSNAYKYTSKSNNVTIEFGTISNSDFQDNYQVYYIKDNGVGFDMKKAEKIFTPFVRLHNNFDFEGTGIGLATVQKIIHLHEGKIWCEAEVNRGATFYFKLPQKKGN